MEDDDNAAGVPRDDDVVQSLEGDGSIRAPESGDAGERPKVYLETTIVSYLAARPSRDVVIAGHQQVTREWWDRRSRFEVFVSQAVVDEAKRGDAQAAARRTALLTGVPVLELGAGVDELAAQLLERHAVPAQAPIDAIHIAVAAVNRVDYLLTWNCSHIANAAVRGKIEEACASVGLKAPVICTPEELMEP